MTYDLSPTPKLSRMTAFAAGPVHAPPLVHDVLHSSAQPLDASTRSMMEPRFGQDFSQVRVHTDSRAAESAQAVNALAYTVGRDIVFGAGQYAPQSSPGRNLLAHELTHVVQQSQGSGRSDRGLQVQDDDRAEAEAEASAAGGQSPVPVRGRTAIRIARQPKPMDPRHARGYGGEQTMGFGYSQEKGWIIIEGPSGSAGHGVTTKGFDGVAYNATADELHLIDNKSLKAGTVSSATAITKNLEKNLDTLIQKVEGLQDMPSQKRILQLLKEMRANIAKGIKIPKNTKLIVTGEGGQAKAVSGTLQKQGVEFREPGTTDVPSTGKAQPKTSGASVNPEKTPTVPTQEGGPPSKTSKPPPAAVNEPPLASEPGMTPNPETAPVIEPPVPPLATPPVRPTTAWKAGLKAGGKALIVALIFAGLDYWVHHRLEKELEASIDLARHGAMGWARHVKRDDPSKPVYMRIKVESREYSHFIPLLGWMPDPPVLHMIQIAMVRDEIDPPIVKVEDNRLAVWHPGVTTTVTYTELMIP